MDPFLSSWKEKVIAKLAAVSEHDRVMKERKQISERLKRLSKVYVDGLIEERECSLHRKLLQDRLETLVVPEMDATIKAGELIENLGNVWHEATPEEKHRLLTIMLDAVYVDLINSRSIVGILPKPAFQRLFESLKQKPDSKVIIFQPEEGTLEAPDNYLGMVETGESWSLPETMLYFVSPTCSAAEEG